MSGVNEFVVNLDPAYVDAKSERTGRLRRIGGTALIVVGIAMTVVSVAGGAATLDQSKAIYGWIVTAALGLLTCWIGWGQITSGRAPSGSEQPTEVFTILPQGISIPFPGQRIPVLERKWGAFSLKLGTASGKPVLHFVSDNGPKGDFQLTWMDASAEEIEAALRRFSKGKQGIEGFTAQP